MSPSSVVSSFILPITWCVWSTQPDTDRKYMKKPKNAAALTRPTISGNVTLRRAMRSNCAVSRAAFAGMGGFRAVGGGRAAS